MQHVNSEHRVRKGVECKLDDPWSLYQQLRWVSSVHRKAPVGPLHEVANRHAGLQQCNGRQAEPSFHSMQTRAHLMQVEQQHDAAVQALRGTLASQSSSKATNGRKQ